MTTLIGSVRPSYGNGASVILVLDQTIICSMGKNENYTQQHLLPRDRDLFYFSFDHDVRRSIFSITTVLCAPRWCDSIGCLLRAYFLK